MPWDEYRPDMDQLQQLIERQAITTAMHRYCRAADARDAEGFVSVFADDGWGDYTRGPIVGREALRAFFEKFIGRLTEATQHQVSNIDIEFDDDQTVQAVSYVTAWHRFRELKPDYTRPRPISRHVEEGLRRLADREPPDRGSRRGSSDPRLNFFAVKFLRRWAREVVEVARLSAASAILAAVMPDFDPGISPEPIRPMFNSDREHARAWLAWAERTPGGWRARLADKLGTSEAADTLPPAWLTTDGPPGLVPTISEQTQSDSPGPGLGVGATPTASGLVRYVEQPSPCCETTVVLDPEASWARHGICSGCGTVLRKGIVRWEHVAPSSDDV